MAARHAAFSWVPKADLYPLFSVFGAAMSVLVYCSYRAIAHNPDVHLVAAHRQDGAAESGHTLSRAQLYHESIFRKAYQLRARDNKDEAADTRIFQ